MKLYDVIQANGAPVRYAPALKPCGLQGRLHELRQAAGLTQMEAGEAIGVSHRAIGYWERGERAITWRHMTALLALYGVTVEVRRGVGK